MKPVFADASYWIAVVNAADQYANAARGARTAIGEAPLLTTEEVLVEFVNALSAHDPGVRVAVARMVRLILSSDQVTVVAQSSDSFLGGLELYERRLDKGYSLTDCVSMCAMDSYGTQDILTTDDHFRQAGYNVLMAKAEDERVRRSRPSRR